MVIYQLGTRELLQNRYMKLIDCMIVSDAICHCDEAASLLHDKCELVFRKLVGRSGHPDLSPIVPALRATNKLRSLFSTK